MRFPSSWIALGLGLFCAESSFAQAKIDVALSVNGGPATKDPIGRIPYQTQDATFIIDQPPGQVRHRLVGIDPDWKLRTGDMFFIVGFYNEKGDQVGQKSFLTKGKSRGWNESIEKSTLTSRKEILTVPPDTHHVTAAISSAGPATTVGTFAISNVRVSAQSSVGSRAREVIGDAAQTVWSKGGTRPSMASTRTLDDGSLLHVIHDDDITGHADLRTDSNPASQVKPGETIVVQWQEIFSTGMGSPLLAKYQLLPPGSYRLEIQSLGFDGENPANLTVLPIEVAFPYWKNPWYWALFLVFAAIASYLLAHHLIRKKIQLHLRQAQIIADERLRIARDLHDDLGARLSHISLLGSHAAGSTSDADTQQTFRQITSMSRELITSLSETVWMLNSKNDRLESLINYLCRMVSELCKSLDIRCRIDAESPPEDQPVNHEIRHHVTMAVKESVNNALKHSHCTEIRLSVHLQPSGLHISIADNGIGLTAEGSEQGNGLENIRQRMSALNGRTEILESDQGGVIVHLHVPI